LSFALRQRPLSDKWDYPVAKEGTQSFVGLTLSQWIVAGNMSQPQLGFYDRFSG